MSGAWVCPPGGHSPGSYRRLGRRQPGGSAALRQALRRGAALFFTDGSANQGRRWCNPAVCGRRVNVARRRGLFALTSPEPDLYFGLHPPGARFRYRLERTVAFYPERVLFEAQDLILKRQVNLRVNLYPDEATRTWLYARPGPGTAGPPVDQAHLRCRGHRDLAYRVGNWIEGEGLQGALQRGPRPIPMVHTLARDLLSALEHAHTQGIILAASFRPRCCSAHPAGPWTTDVRFCSYTLPAVPPGPSRSAWRSWPRRSGRAPPGDPTSDVYTAGALLYVASPGRSRRWIRQDPPAHGTAAG